MQLLSIENLSLAAEVTVVLLLLAFAWPQTATHHEESSERGESVSWEPVKFFFLQNWLHRGLYLNARNQHHQPSPAAPKAFQPTVIEDDHHAQPPTPWQDRLTHLLNRQGFDAILNAWLSIDGQHRGDACLSMVTLSTYSDLTSAHGAMVTEQAIQRIGKQLSVDLSHDSLIARYLPDRFVVLHFAATIASSQKAIAHFHAKTLDDSFFQAAGKPLHLPCTVSILGLKSESDVNATMDLLEEGISDGERSGRAIVALENGDWLDTPVDLAGTAAVSSSHEAESQLSSSTSSTEDAVATESEKEVPESNVTPSAEQPHAPSSSLDDAQQASNDISAVASPDDIAALFAQINTQKSGTGELPPPPTVDAVTQSQPKETSNSPVADANEAATADDIAALFATVKPNAKSATTPPNPPATKAPAIEPAIAEIDKTEAASADDIAALFATIKPTAKAATPAPPVAVPNAAKSDSKETAKPVADIDPNEAATADDIAALFATVKPTKKTTQDVAPVANPGNVKRQSVESNNPVADVDPNEAATADDIAALFATVKPTAKAPVAPVAVAPSESKPAGLSAEESAESATADDIAALFATVKTAVKPSTPAAPSQPPKPDPSSKPSISIPSGAELSEVASADDIAMLLATVKPATPVASQPAQASKPASPAIPTGEQLNEAASADDIAALFASVKPAPPANSASQEKPDAPTPKPAAPSPPVPQEDLSANASLDDIEALFAAMKK